MIPKRRILSVTLCILCVIGVTLIISLNTGYLRIAPIDVLRVLVGKGSPQDALVLIQFRLPRMVIALFIGAGMAVSGALLQGITQNDLADPGILGINSGAGLAVVFYISMIQGQASALSGLSLFLMPFSALFGAALAALIIYALAWQHGVTPLRLILSGIGVNAAFMAVITIIQLRMDPKDFMQATIWLSGSIWGTDWPYVLAILPWMLILIPLATFKARTLNILALGDAVASGLGVAVNRERTLFLIIAVALAGASVSVGGGIAFLGLIVPHLVRRIIGRRHEVLIPLSALMGACLLLIADTLSRTIWAPAEVPVGLVVSAIGAPYFIYLLFREKI
ncbi:FecCD family ABC transporter permease [Sporolactobacillus terrae]|uniref:Iron(3+)-hydroxamate import system permease protein FhuG n=1 Tax=Sporolactobacillus terrae TaxID=269673 RepID=A0A5K7X2F1_9BACL|nr:iron ABC transporter permease [Sporolactobacillus terrae]BBO00220.1 iron(3+)-hydroxamate import system permease protein FhuG [Sporolactobacillus terrae]